jgi:hypothetical protein
MGKGVFTRLKRFTLVEKTGSEVGAGTAFPLKVTRPQLAELFYRVRDAKFSGSVTAQYAFTTLSLVADDTTAPPSDFHSGTTSDVICQRSYVIGDPPVNLDDERKIWTAALEAPAPPFSTILPVNQTHLIITGATHYLESFYALPLDYHVRGDDGTGEYTAAIELAFSGQVAWVDVNASGNPFDSANELWVGMGFQCYTADLVAAIVDAYSLKTGDSNEGESGDLTIVLSSGLLTCRLYASQFAFLTSAYSDLTLTATEWWPYAKGSPATPVWDADSGALL